MATLSRRMSEGRIHGRDWHQGGPRHWAFASAGWRCVVVLQRPFPAGVRGPMAWPRRVLWSLVHAQHDDVEHPRLRPRQKRTRDPALERCPAGTRLTDASMKR